MKIHEYQAKELLAAAGAPIPRGIVASSPAEAQAAFDQLGGPVVLKAQVHAGGRGKGRFKDSGKDFGGVKFIKNRADVAAVAEVMFHYPLVTKQTGADGPKGRQGPRAGGGRHRPRDLRRHRPRPRHRQAGADGQRRRRRRDRRSRREEPGKDSQGNHRPRRRPATVPGAPAGVRPGLQGRRRSAQAERIMQALARVFLDKDCSLAEINPLIVTPKGEVVVLDAKITFDDNALFRHPDIEKLRDEAEENPAELRAAASGLSYISLTGNIGCLVNGAGLAMSTMDIIKYHGGEPANFLDVGGGANKDQVTEALRILLADSSAPGRAHQHLRRHHEVRHHRRRRHRRLPGSEAEGAVRGAAGRHERRAGPQDARAERPEPDDGDRSDRRGEKGSGGGEIGRLVYA